MIYWANLINIILIFITLGISLNFVLGYSGMISLGHAVYFGVAAYAMALLSMNFGIGFVLASVIAIVGTGLFAAATAFPALRVRGEYLILLTLALQMIATGVMNGWIELTGGPSGIPGITPVGFGDLRLFNPLHLLPVLLLLTVGAFLIAKRITRSPFGRLLKAMRDNESATIAAGKDIVRIKVIIFSVSGLYAGLAGVLYAGTLGFIDPSAFSLDVSIILIALVALGGRQTSTGPWRGQYLSWVCQNC